MSDLRPAIQSALQSLSSGPLRSLAISLLKTLGYQSDRTLNLEGSKPHAFLDLIASQGGQTKFDEAKALFSDWKSADILFQLSDADISGERSLFKDTTVQPSLLQSYLFFAIELKGKDYARGKLTGIARQINRVFPMPVMLLIRHGDSSGAPVLSIAVINRRRNKVHAEKDVLEKVTLIRDVSLSTPHRGHLDILQSFAFSELEHPKKLPITNFDTLHAAWEQIFNIELLNNRFYKELANWYFWALPQVEFPADLEADDEKRRATGLIRLLTRLIFCWFLKEKNLIPEKLFHPADLAKILKGFDRESETSSTYYQAILQNLFFATLNQRMGKDGNGKPYRVFATDEGFAKNRATYDINNLYRYEALFRDEPAAALAHFADIPFLNGGLFECLDRTEDGTDKKRYLDGFSRNAKKRPHVPDRLFFDTGETADLSEVYGDKKRKAEKVTGLITILNRYKFTIVENTPIDQEIALDPELLGKVFENLLASYNEETKTTARKQTGSFYTPRPIVDYMVDESLKAHLQRKVEQTFLSAQSNEPQTGMSVPPISKTRRNLPHWKKDGSIYWITFRMADSLPQEKLRAWKAERDIWSKQHPEPWDEATWKEYNERFGDKLDQWLDAGTGSRALARKDVREAVKSCLLKFDGERLVVHSAVIMPNHVHALIEPIDGHDLSKLLQGIKGASAREANKLLGGTGTFWLDESYDHIVRSETQYKHFLRYIADNPLKAELRENEFWLLKGGADIPVCASSSKKEQTGMSAPLSQRLDHLFSYTEQPHQFTPAEVATLIAAIDALKILDPACGSGAFPMGVLHKLVYILGKLDPDNGRWKHTQLAKLDSAPMREELERAFADNNDDYGRKLYLIENCLYGVDIQPIAIQITKLRFFISLVCDQKTNRNKKDNHGIRPLPNLETKFVAANSLIGLPISDKDLFIESLIAPIEKEIEDAYHGHFTIQRRDQKLALQKKIKGLRHKLADTLAASLGAVNSKKAKHLAEWDPFDPQSTADFFDPHWMFGKTLADGFDVVVGNPPYVLLQAANRDDALTKYFRQNYKVASYKIDLYHLFIEQGVNLLKPSGTISLITPTNFASNNFTVPLRRFLLTETHLEKLVFFDEGVFDASVHNLVFVAHTNRQETNATSFYKATMADAQLDLQKKLEVAQSELIDDMCLLMVRTGNTAEAVIQKMNLAGETFGSVATVNFGMQLRDRSEFRDDVVESPKSKYSLTKFHRECYAGRDVHRFYVSFTDRYCYFNREAKRGGCWDEDIHLAKGKILVRQIGSYPEGGLDMRGYAVLNASFMILPRSKAFDDSKFLLGVLNSSAIRFYWLNKFKDDRKTFPKIKGEYLKLLPLPKAEQEKQTQITQSVSRIIDIKEKDPAADTSALEREIDQQVYALYGLTPEEIAIVEGSAK